MWETKEEVLGWLGLTSRLRLEELRSVVWFHRTLTVATPVGRPHLIRDARLLVDEEEAALVRALFKRRAEGANFGELLRFLEGRGVRMSKTGIRALLKNRAYDR